MTVTSSAKPAEAKIVPWTNRLSQLPWWALLILLLGVLIVFLVITNADYNDAFIFLLAGVRKTVTVSLVSFGIALVLGLITGLGRVSKNVVVYNLASFYVELVRGIPMLILIIYFAYVVTPLVVEGLNGLGSVMWQGGILRNLAYGFYNLHVQDVDTTLRAVAGLAFGYGAFEAEVFRAGIQSIGRGQMEAARSLGMTYFQAMRYVILPQAIRRILPPLGNDFISMLKDSSLISVLAVRDLTHLGKLNRARTFQTYPTWNTVAFLYLSMTLLLSMAVKAIERRMSFDE